MKKKYIALMAFMVLLITGSIFYILQNNKTNSDLSNTASEKTKVRFSSDSKVLIVYFSLPETEDPKNMTDDEESSTVVVDGKVLGNTQYVAQLIANETKGTLYRIEASDAYPLDHETLVEQAKQEQKDDARPVIVNEISDFEEYDTIYLGYPIWWSDLPQILYSFMESYDFSDKTIIPFSTHGGSGLSDTIDTIQDKLSGANVVTNGFTLSRDDMESAPKEVESWLKEIGAIQ